MLFPTRFGSVEVAAAAEAVVAAAEAEAEAGGLSPSKWRLRRPPGSPSKNDDDWAPLFWEPRMFFFDDVTFYQVRSLYRDILECKYLKNVPGLHCFYGVKHVIERTIRLPYLHNLRNVTLMSHFLF